MKARSILTMAAAVLLAPAGFAQQAQPAEQANVGRIYWSWARAGQVQPYEAGTKKHNELHKMKKDPWSWLTFQVVSGNRAGQYIIGTFWRQWKDFDNLPVPQAEDDADYLKNVEPHEANWKGEHIVFMSSHSYPPEDNSTPYPIYQLWKTEVRGDMAEAYLNAVRKIPEAAKKAGVSWRYNFWAIADGDSTSSFYVSFPMKTWAERADQGSPFEEVLTKAYGRAEAHGMIAIFNKAVTSQTSMMVVYRPDLSYVPAP